MARRRIREKNRLEVATLDAGDLVTLAQCHALDATVFPHPSLPVLLGPPSVIVARDAGGVVGFASLRRTGPIIELAGLAVDPDRRRTGVGRALFRAAVETARARRAVTFELHVSTANAAAIALYEGEGLRRKKRIRRFYSPERFGDGGDAWRMVLRLR